MEKITDAVMSEKPRYAILDGLRGVAAVIVVAFHLFETYSKGPASNIEPRLSCRRFLLCTFWFRDRICL